MVLPDNVNKLVEKLYKEVKKDRDMACTLIVSKGVKVTRASNGKPEDIIAQICLAIYATAHELGMSTENLLEHINHVLKDDE